MNVRGFFGWLLRRKPARTQRLDLAAVEQMLKPRELSAVELGYLLALHDEMAAGRGITDLERQLQAPCELSEADLSASRSLLSTALDRSMS